MCADNAELTAETAGSEAAEAIQEGAPDQNGSTGAYRRLLRNPNFRRLWVSQFVSGIGDWLVIGFLMPLVTSLSGGSSFAVAGILIAKIIPALVLSSFTGVLVDRFDRRRTMITADLARAGLTLGLLFTNSVWVIYLIVMLMEVGSLFFYPARNALIPYLVEEEDVPAANGLSYTTQQASMLIGLTASAAILAAFEAVVSATLGADIPGLATLVDPLAPALLGPRAGVFVNSLTFLVSALIIMSIRVVARPPNADAQFSLDMLGKDVLDSFRFLRDHRELRGFLITIGLAILGGGAIIPVGLVHVQQNLVGAEPIFENFEFLQRLAAAPQTFMLAFLAVGMVAGALLVPRLFHRVSLQWMFLGSVSGFGLAMVGFAWVSEYYTAAFFAMVAGFAIATVTVAGNTYIVYTVDDSIRGRVFTALEVVIKVALLVSMIVMAPLGDLVGSAVKWFVDTQEIAAVDVTLTGSQITLLVGAGIVFIAAFYAFRTLNLKGCEEGQECEEDETEPASPSTRGSAEGAGSGHAVHAEESGDD
jgi:dTMP kinase